MASGGLAFVSLSHASILNKELWCKGCVDGSFGKVLAFAKIKTRIQSLAPRYKPDAPGAGIGDAMI